VSEVHNWLSKLGLQQYASRFAENGIDITVLPDLTEEDLKELGVLLGHRRRIFRAIAQLKGSTLAVDANTSAAQDTAERRQLTVMFCDLVDSTALSVRLDPEDMRKIIRAYQEACIRVLPIYDGFLAKYLGDGILVYFGYPRAHEDDAERAVRAGLEIVAAVSQLKSAAGVPLKARVGIATGTVVVGDLVGEGVALEQSVIGETPNLAARLQTMADPGTVVVADSTRRLLGDVFRLQGHGERELKGFTQPVAIWTVEGEIASDNRFEAVRPARLTSFIGRQDEINLLLERQHNAWRLASGQVVLISGEPGIGKSRIAANFSERTAETVHTRLRYQCSPYHTNTALFPFIGQLERAAGFKPEDSPERKLEKIEALVSLATTQNQRVVPLIAALLSVTTTGSYPPLGLSPAQQHRQTLATLLDQLEGLAKRNPVLLLFEDAHWADAPSLELLDFAIERVRHLPVLVLITFRPEFEPPWTGLDNVTTLTLRRFEPEHIRTMIQQIAGGRTLPAAVAEQIISKTDGIPLFVEELTKSIMESGLLVQEIGHYRLDHPLPPLAIPATLQDSLMARLDRLAPVKETAQIGAAIGREFSYALLSMVVERDYGTLAVALAQLEAAELVSRRGVPPDAIYTFKHALVQDAAYESMLKSRRKILHGRIALILRERFPTIADSEPAMIAHHFTQAGQTQEAIEWWGRAGDQARGRFAFAQATAHLGKAIDLADGLPDEPERRLVRLRLQIAYANAHLHASGPAAKEPTAAFARARDIAVGVQDAPERFSAYYGLWVSHYCGGNIAAMREVAEAALGDLGREPGASETSMVYRALGMTSQAQGLYAEAREHLEQSLACYNPETDRGMVWFGVDTAVATLVWLAVTLCAAGENGRATRLADESLTRAKRTAHVPTLVYAYSTLSMFESIRYDCGRALAQSEAALALAREHEMPLYLAIGTFFHGWARFRSGERDAGLLEMSEGTTLIRSQVPLYLPLVLALQAEAEGAEGRTENALLIIKDALAEGVRMAHAAYTAEAYRIMGELLIRHDRADIGPSEGALATALAIARRQKAAMFELRAALALGRLYSLTGRASAGRDLLEPIIAGWTAEPGELAEAQRLLEDLM
jgi:class 3 adenylate cyclase